MSAVSGSGLSLGTLWVSIQAQVDEALAGLEKFGKDVGKIIDEQKAKWEGLADVGKSLTGLGGTLTAAITAPLAAVAGLAVSAATSLEKLRNGLIAVEGSAEAADKRLEELRDIAKLPGLGLDEAVQGYTRLKAVGVAAQDAEKYLRVFGNALATVGKGKADLEGVVTQLTQMSAKTKVVAEDLKPVLERVPQVATILKEAYGTIDTEELQKAGKTTQEVIDTIVAGLEKLPPVTGGLANAFENLQDSAQRSLAAIGQVLTPVVTQLTDMLDRLLGKIQDAAKWFNNLPGPIKSMAIALAGLLALIPPLLFAVGSFAGALANLGPPLIALAKFLEIPVVAAAGLVGAVTLTVAALAGLAIWVYSNWDKVVATIANGLIWVINQIQAFIAAAQDLPLVGGLFRQVSESLEGVKQRLQETADAHNYLAKNLRSLGDFVAEYWARQAKAVQYAREVINNALEHIGADQKTLDAERKASAKAAEDLEIQTTKTLQDEVDKRVNALAVIKKGYADHINSLADVQAAENSLRQAQADLARGDKDLAEARKQAADEAKKRRDQALKDEEDAIKAEQNIAVTRARNVKAYDELLKQVNAFAARMKEHNQALTHANELWTLFSNGLKEVKDNIEPVIGKLEDLDKILPKIVPPKDAFTQYLDDVHNLGEKTKYEYEQLAKKAEEVYDRMATGGKASAREILVAEIDMLEAQQQAYIETFGVYSDLLKEQIDAAKKALDEIEGKTQAHLKHTQSLWQQWGKQIQSILANFAGDIFRRLFEGSDTNKQLDQQAADLQKSLAERAAQWQQYQADNAAKQAQATADYEADLAKEDAAYAQSLADKQADFDKFAADTAAKQAKLDADYQADLAKTTKDYEDSLADKLQDYDDYVRDATDKEAEKEKDLASDLDKERKSLQDSLDDRTLDYNRYVEDVTSNIAEISRTHAESLANDLRDLDDSLNDRRQEYADYVQDANRSLARIGEDHADNIARETEDTQANIAAQTKDYKRYVSDTQAQLAQVRKKHGGVYSKEEDDLQKSLDRRTEDYNDSVAEQQRKLTQFVSEEKRKQQQEEDDLKASLDRKARDQAAYENEVQTKRAETIAKNKADQDRDVSAQQAALTRKTEDFDAFQKEISGKLAAAEQEYETGLAENRAALAEQLAAKKADLDQYNADAAEKYGEDAGNLNAAYAEDKGNLETELGEKIADLGQFNTDAKTKHDENRANAKASYEGATGDLETELGNQLADYTQFVTDTNTKLNEIREAHRSVWQDIGGFGVAAIEAIGQALVELAASKALEKLVGLIPGLGGAASSAGSAAGGAASGADDAAGAIGSGITGIVGAVGGVVSAVSGVISNFQLAGVNKSLDVIVNHTLRMFNELFNLRRDEWDRWGGWMLIKDDILTRLNAIMDASNLAILKFDDMIRALNSIMDSTAHASAALERMAGGPDTEAGNSLLERMYASLQQIALHTAPEALAGQSVNVNLYGTDPSLVSAKLGTQLRLQGGFA